MLSKPARHINNSESHKGDPAETASQNHTKKSYIIEEKKTTAIMYFLCI